MNINEQNYADEAEKVINKLKNLKRPNGKAIPLVTTSKIRNLLAMTADIYNEVLNQRSEELGTEICSRIEYLRIRFIYEAGRDESVKRFVTEAEVIDVLKHINGERKKYILFNRYMEALVAFHKFYGGKDN